MNFHLLIIKNEKINIPPVPMILKYLPKPPQMKKQLIETRNHTVPTIIKNILCDLFIVFIKTKFGLTYYSTQQITSTFIDRTNKKEFSFPFNSVIYILVKGKPLIDELQLTDNGFVQIFNRYG